MRRMLSGFLVACLAIVAMDARADLVTNPITASNPSASNPYTTGQTVAANLSFLGIGRGSGINANAGSNRYNASSWNTASLDPTAYFSFIFTPGAGHVIDFSSFEYTGEASGSGPTSFAFRSSIDSYTTNIGAPTASGTSISLTAPAYQGITSTTEFRLYGWNASSASGTFSVNDFTFDGTVTAVPEPSSIAVAVIGGVGGVVARYRRRKAKAAVAELVA